MMSVIAKKQGLCPLHPVTPGQPSCPTAVFAGARRGALFCRFACSKSVVHTICQVPLKLPQVTTEVSSTITRAPVTPPSPSPSTLTTLKSMLTTRYTYRPTYPLESSIVNQDDGIALPVPIIPAQGTSDRTFATDRSTVPVDREMSSTPTLLSSTSSLPSVSETASPDQLLITTVPPSTYTSSVTSISKSYDESSSTNSIDTVTPDRVIRYTCSGGFQLVDNRCYRLFIGQIEGNDVRSSCLSLSAKPAAIVSSAVQRFFTSQIVDRKRPVFIGARLTQAPFGYGWLNGKGDLFRYTNWAPGEPNPMNGECVVMRPDGQWQSYQCYQKAQYTCE